MARHTDAFAARLRELKDRSGRSYGALAQRLHTSTSTLHRYCNGTTVPAEFAPAERFARACGATPEEVLALHRMWLLADAERRAEAAAGRAEAAGSSAAEATAHDDQAGSSATEATTSDAAAPDSGGDPAGSSATEATASGAAERGSNGDPAGSSATEAAASSTSAPDPIAAAVAFGTTEPGPNDLPAGSRPILISPGSKQTADRSASRWLKPALAGLAAAAVLVPLALYATRDSGSSAHSPSHSAGSAPTSSTTTPSPSPSPSPSAPAPVTVDVLADNWDTECGQWFYATQPPTTVPPPPGLPDVGLWAQPLGAVPGGHLRLQLTAQGTPGLPPVVLHTLYVHVVGAKPAPKIKAVVGQTANNNVGLADFPFQVSGSDSQVLDVDAHSADQEIDWNLVLVWSCGDQQGTLTVDDHGKPFRTIGLNGKPAYFHNGVKCSIQAAKDISDWLDDRAKTSFLENWGHFSDAQEVELLSAKIRMIHSSGPPHSVLQRCIHCAN